MQYFCITSSLIDIISILQQVNDQAFVHQSPPIVEKFIIVRAFGGAC